jgi:hypothetical protein
MTFRLRKTSVKRRSLCRGLLAGAVLSAVLIFVLTPLYQPWPVEGANPSDACFSPDECSLDMANAAACKKSTGCCFADRCFVPDATNVCASKSMGFCYAKSPPFELAVVFGATTSVIDLSEYIQTVYKYSVGIAAVMAAVVMMIGGLMYLTAGSSERVARGKEFIVDSLTGLLVILCAYLILNTVNPDTLTLQLPKIPVVKQQKFAGCSMTELCRPCGEQYGLSEAYLKMIKETGYSQGQGAAKNGQSCSSEYIVGPADPGVKATCYGASCTCATGGACNDVLYRCRKRRAETDVQDCGTALKDSKGQPIGQPQQPAAPAGGQPAAQPPAQGGTPATPPPKPDYMCMSCKPDGGDCVPNGKNENCCAGFCAASKCTGGMPGDDCCKTLGESLMCNEQCANGGICQTNWGNSCSMGNVGVPCAGNQECKSGYKCGTSGNNACTPGTKYSWCDENSECTGGMVCDTSGFNLCMPPGARKTYSCSNNWDMQKNYDEGCGPTEPFCVNLSKLRKNFCTDGSLGAPCSDDWDCLSQICVTRHSYGVCVDGEDGSICEKDGIFVFGPDKTKKGDCKSGHCYKKGDYGVCVSGGTGSRCNGGNTDCLNQLQCKDKRCIPNVTSCNK